MKRITDIKELRSIQLGILDDIHNFCIANGITYFISCGSLIGAVRHKGYIPWDDDIDLYMPRKDYERFIKEYRNPSKKYRVINPETEKNYFYTFAKVVDTRTLMTETETEGYKIGVYVDLFPVDYVSDDRRERVRLFKRTRLLYKIRRCKISHKNYLKNAAAYWIYKLLPVSVGCLNRIIRRLITLKQPTHTVANLTEAGCFNADRCFSAASIDGTVDVEFEGRRYKTMKGYKDYLSKTYGDYMTLPPVDQRQTHSFEAYWL